MSERPLTAMEIDAIYEYYQRKMPYLEQNTILALIGTCRAAWAERDSWKMRYEASQDALREVMREHTELVEAVQRVRRERGSVEYRPDGEPPTVYLATVPHEAMDALDAALATYDEAKGQADATP